MITVEEYAELCALMAAGDSDESKELAIARANNVTPNEWKVAKAYYTKRMSDPRDLGATALAFIPAYQKARVRAGVDEPCSLEKYTRVLADLAYRQDHDGFSEILGSHGLTRESWQQIEQYWSPRIASESDPRFSPGQATRFRVLMASEHERAQRMHEMRAARRRAG